MAYPNIILITDTIPRTNGAGGISQTLYNLLNHYPGKIWVVTKPDEKEPSPPFLKATVIHFPMEPLKSWKYRGGRIVNPYIAKINHWLLDQRSISIPELQGLTNTFILVSTSFSIKLHFAYCLQKQFNYPILPYFMDDWVNGYHLSWWSNNLHQITKKLHEKANAWLMISENLHKTFLDRYKLTDKSCLVIHNPAPDVLAEISPETTVEEGLIIYAGSIWTMHLDAIEVTAKAVSHLHTTSSSKFRLLIYTTPSTWEYNKKALEMPGVSFGGFIPYEQLQVHLHKACLLLVPASFLPENSSFAQSSVQTKLTDYMASGRPVIYVGPSKGASENFVKQWDCGFYSNTQTTTEFASMLEKTMADKEVWKLKANNSKQAIAEHFNQEAVQKKLYAFFQKHY